MYLAFTNYYIEIIHEQSLMYADILICRSIEFVAIGYLDFFYLYRNIGYLPTVTNKYLILHIRVLNLMSLGLFIMQLVWTEVSTFI